MHQGSLCRIVVRAKALFIQVRPWETYIYIWSYNTHRIWYRWSNKTSKAIGPDGISNLLLKHLGPLGLEYLTNVFNLSLQNTIIPQILSLSLYLNQEKDLLSPNPIDLFHSYALQQKSWMINSTWIHRTPTYPELHLDSGKTTLLYLLSMTLIKTSPEASIRKKTCW